MEERFVESVVVLLVETEGIVLGQELDCVLLV